AQVGRGDAPRHGVVAVGFLDDADAPGIHGASLPPGRRHRGRRTTAGAAGHRGRLRVVPPRISLALALHNHQPVGNFGWVFADVFEKAYAPMIDALERHPDVRLSLHYTGPLLDWLAARGEREARLPRARL